MNRIGRQRHEKGRLIATLALIATIPACDTLLDVQDPDIIEPDQLRTLQGASALYNGAIGEFASRRTAPPAVPGRPSASCRPWDGSATSFHSVEHRR